MNWSYIAGYFDGEGHVAFHRNGKRQHMAYGLHWYNSHLRSLEAMREFIGFGNINKRKARAHQTYDVYILGITQRQQVLTVIDAMMPHLIVKLEVAKKLRNYLMDEKFREISPIRVTDFTRDDLHQEYWTNGKSAYQIAKEKGCSMGLINKALIRLGISRRPAGGSFLEGTKKSPETIERMKIAQQRRRKLNA